MNSHKHLAALGGFFSTGSFQIDFPTKAMRKIIPFSYPYQHSIKKAFLTSLRFCH